MLARAGLLLNFNCATLPSRAFLVTGGLAVKLRFTGSNSIMFFISSHSNPSAASKTSHPCCLVRSHCSWRTEHAVLFRKVTTQSGFSKVTPLLSRERLSKANVCSWSTPGTYRCVLPPDRSSWQGSRFEVEQRFISSNQGFPTWVTANPNYTTWGASCTFNFSSGSGNYKCVENGAGFRSHAVSRQSRRYVLASAQEDFILENLEEQGEEVEHGNGNGNESGNGIEIAGTLQGTEAGNVEENANKSEISVVNFYHFVIIEDPHLEVSRHSSFLEGKDVRGRIYISHQGINAQLSGPGNEAIDYAEWVKEDSRFSNMLVQISPSPVGHAFPRLRLRYKPSLVQVEGGTLHLPITDPSAGALRLSPREWTERLDASTVLSNNSESQELISLQDGLLEETSKAKNAVVLLDVRNGYEWDVGHFKGAHRPYVDCFKATEFGLTEKETVKGDPLANVDKDAVDVMMYCTGGIRCDVFATMLRQKGFKNLYTLKGGVSNYLKEEGAGKWSGNLFVFDSRLAVPPKDYHLKDTREDALFECNKEEELDSADNAPSQAFARCRLCGDPIFEPRHRNCANLDCNLLYMSCEACLAQHNGCCSTTCVEAPRLRPLLARHQYDRWHNYRPQEENHPKPVDYVSRRAMKRRRRKERRKLLLRGTANYQFEGHVFLTEDRDKELNFATVSDEQK